jgi:2-iminobutanoate/2-iminopropanoate deaminase
MTHKKVVYTDKAPAPVGPYSQAIRVGPWLFLSGQIAIDPATQQWVGGSIEEQTERVMENLRAVVEAAGGSLEDLVQVTGCIPGVCVFRWPSSVFGARCSALGVGSNPVPGIRYQVPGSWYPIPGTGSLNGRPGPRLNARLILRKTRTWGLHGAG